MKKTIFTVLAFLLLSTSSFAKCSSINLGFVTIISGTTWVEQTSWVDNGTTFVQVTTLVEVPCSAGNRWQWFWE